MLNDNKILIDNINEIVDFIQCYSKNSYNKFNWCIIEALVNAPKLYGTVNDDLKNCLWLLSTFSNKYKDYKTNFININTFKLRCISLSHNKSEEDLNNNIDFFINEIINKHDINRFIVNENPFVNKLLPIKTWFTDIPNIIIDKDYLYSIIDNDNILSDCKGVLFIYQVLNNYLINYPNEFNNELKLIIEKLIKDLSHWLSYNGNPNYSNVVSDVVDKLKLLIKVK